jgi:uncharacterized protein YebE (UPF0316 family)
METLRPLLIASLVLTEVGIWQWRMVIAHRGNRATAMLLGFLGAILQITAISQVIADVHDPFSIAAYAAGVALGVLLGLVAGDRLTPGLIGVTIVTSTPHLDRTLWALDWPATAQPGFGETGPVTVLFVVISRRDEQRLHAVVDGLAPDAFWSAKDLRSDAGSTRRPRQALARAAS